MTYTDPGAAEAMLRALGKALPDCTVPLDYIADLITLTLRGDGFGIETYPEIIAKRQAALAEPVAPRFAPETAALYAELSSHSDDARHIIESMKTATRVRFIGHLERLHAMAIGIRLPEAGE